MAIEESKDLTSPSLDELIEKLKAKKESSDEECSTSESEDEEYVMAVRDFKKFFKRRDRFVRQPQNDQKTFQRSRDEKNGKSDRKCFRCGDPKHLIGECTKPPKDKNQRAFFGEEDVEKVNNKTCLVAQASSESLASKELVRNLPKLKFDQHFCDACKIRRQAHTSHKAKNIVSTTRCLKLLHMDLFGPSAVRSYGGNRYTLVIVDDYSRKVEDSPNVTFDETPTPSKTSPLVDYDLDKEDAIKVTKKKNLENDIKDETLEIDKIVNIKESRNHPLENVIRNLNQRTLRLDIMFSVYLCARFQEAPKTSYLKAVKRIFRYIKGTTHLGLWYPKKTGIEIVKQTALAISTTEAEYVSARKRRPRESKASSSSTTLKHPSSSRSLDDTIDENDDESFHSNSSSPSQNISSSSNIVPRVRQNPPRKSHNLNTYLSKTINLQTQQQDAHREGLGSIRQALKNMTSRKRK
nr:retrovirus-related Pol polyprotein from transposon TNT 1-94 [Tanacetum cinerariifolium]